MTVFFTCCYSAGIPQALKTVKNPQKYDLVNDWPQLPDGYVLSHMRRMWEEQRQNRKHFADIHRLG